ncbi:MAG: hypothetical protein AAB838_01295, partial [Patescibacteria group bacterium]
SIEQLEKIRGKEIKGRELGRTRASQNRRQQRIDTENKRIEEGMNYFKNISAHELMVAGLALYAGEGSKTKRTVCFCNSDPLIIKLMINWLRVCFGVTDDRFRLSIGINEIHREREGLVKDYWANITKLKSIHFNKTSFKKVQSKKVYTNFNQHFGTLDIKILRSTQIYYKIAGLIRGLLSQGNSVAE